MDWMFKALELAQQGQNSCAPNPMVGCVIVKNNRVVGEGFHQVAGGPHAEVMALREAGEHAFGSHVYITLEPCSHYGRTPPCVDALIKAGVKRVFVAIPDPNPRVNGEGLEKLAHAGIKTQVGSYQEEAYKLNEDFFYKMRHQRPYVVAKWAMSLDGKIATKEGQSKWITSENARIHAHSLRARACAVMIGAGTLRKDNPELTIRHGTEGLPMRQPRPVVVSTQGAFSLDSKIFHNKRNPVVIIGNTASSFVLTQLNALKIEYYVFKLINNKLPLRDVFSKLSLACDFKTVLVEGGSGLLTSLHEENLINQIYAYIAPKIIGGKDSLSPLQGQNIDIIDQAAQLHSEECYNFAPDFCIMAKTSATAKSYEQFLSSPRAQHV